MVSLWLLIKSLVGIKAIATHKHPHIWTAGSNSIKGQPRLFKDFTEEGLFLLQQTGTERKKEHKSAQIGRAERRRLGINKKKNDEPESKEDNLCNRVTQLSSKI